MLVPSVPHTALTPTRNDLTFSVYSRSVHYLPLTEGPSCPALSSPDAGGSLRTWKASHLLSSFPYCLASTFTWKAAWRSVKQTNRSLLLDQIRRQTFPRSFLLTSLYREKGLKKSTNKWDGGRKSSALTECLLYTGVFTFKSFLFLTSNLL